MILFSEPVKGAPLTLLEPARLLKCLGDETRLTLTLLIRKEEELCVCEMTHALEESQPKISRHLAQLRTCGLLNDRREGQWVYYRLSGDVPEWVDELLGAAEKGQAGRLVELQQRLSSMGNRPDRRLAMC